LPKEAFYDNIKQYFDKHKRYHNMRESIKEFVKICAETLPIIEPIYEFGSLQVPGQEGFADNLLVSPVGTLGICFE
jgi:hypothetical protein